MGPPGPEEETKNGLRGRVGQQRQRRRLGWAAGPVVAPVMALLLVVGLIGLLGGMIEEAAAFVLRPRAPRSRPSRRPARPPRIDHGPSILSIPLAASSSSEAGSGSSSSSSSSSSRPPQRRVNGTGSAPAARGRPREGAGATGKGPGGTGRQEKWYIGSNGGGDEGGSSSSVRPTPVRRGGRSGERPPQQQAVLHQPRQQRRQYQQEAQQQRRPYPPKQTQQDDRRHEGQNPQRRSTGHYARGGARPPRPSPRQLEINRELLACGPDAGALLAYTDAHREEMSFFNCATAFNRLSKAGGARPAEMRADPRFRALVERADAAMDQCGDVDLSLVLNGISKLGYDPGEAFWMRARDASLRILPHVSQNAVYVNILNAFGRTRFNPGPRWLATFLETSAPHLSTFTAPELTSLINSFANLRFLPPAQYYAAVSAGIRDRLPEMQPWELGMAVNGFGRAAAVASGGGGGGDRYTVVDDETGGAFHPGFDLVRALEAAALPLLDAFDPQGLAGLVNGFAHLGHQPANAFLDAFVRCVAKRMPRFNSQDYGIILNGLAALGTQPEQVVPGFLDRLRDLALPKLTRFNDQELANLINALGKWDARPGGDFLGAFCACVEHKLEAFTPQGLANVLHALGRLDHYPGPEWMARAVARCLVLVDGFTAQGLAMVVCGLSNLRFHPGERALAALTAAATRRAGEFDQQYLANVWWGTANLGYQPSPAFWAACRERVPWHRILDRLSLFEASTLLYALAVMDAADSRPFLGPLVRRACRNLEARAWVVGDGDKEGAVPMDLETESALRQLHQAFMYVETLREAAGLVDEDGGGAAAEAEIVPGLPCALQDEFGTLIAGAWGASTAHLLAARVRTSSFQQDVQAAAEALGLCCLPEARDGPFTLDFVITPNPASPAYTGGELPVVVEVDGPTHHCVNDPARMTGVSRLKHRLLAAQRHRWAAVVSVSLTEWEPLGFSARKKRTFLEARLREADVALEAYQFGVGKDARQQCALVDPEDVCSPEVLLRTRASSKSTAGDAGRRRKGPVVAGG